MHNKTELEIWLLFKKKGRILLGLSMISYQLINLCFFVIFKLYLPAHKLRMDETEPGTFKSRL